jgi:hypothetical protein
VAKLRQEITAYNQNAKKNKTRAFSHLRLLGSPERLFDPEHAKEFGTDALSRLPADKLSKIHAKASQKLGDLEMSIENLNGELQRQQAYVGKYEKMLKSIEIVMAKSKKSQI